MSVLVQLPAGQKTHYVQEPDGVRNLHMQVPSEVLFYDDLNSGVAGTLIGKSASKVGAWTATQLMPSYAFSGQVGSLGGGIDDNVVRSIELLPGKGLSFNQDKLRLRMGVRLRDGTKAQNTHNDTFTNSLSWNFFCAQGMAYSGIGVLFNNPTIALGYQLQVIYYDEVGSPDIKYASGATEIPNHNIYEKVEILLKRLPGNMVEVSVLFNGSAKVNALQFIVGSHIARQNSIILGIRSYVNTGDCGVHAPIIIDNPDHV
jgi:hypothetical protein